MCKVRQFFRFHSDYLFLTAIFPSFYMESDIERADYFSFAYNLYLLSKVYTKKERVTFYEYDT